MRSVSPYSFATTTLTHILSSIRVIFSIADIQAEEDFEDPESEEDAEAPEDPAPYPVRAALSITKVLFFSFLNIPLL